MKNKTTNLAPDADRIPIKKRVGKCVNVFGYQILIFRPRVSKKQCPYILLDDCKIEIETCECDKKTCLHRLNKKNRQKGSNNHIAWIAVVICALVIIGTLYYMLAKNVPSDNLICTLIIGICVSIVGAAVFSLFVDFPSKLKDYQKYIIDAITDYSYLSRLDEEKLSFLRRAVTRQLHAKDIPSIPDGMLDMDEAICDFIKRPYYKWYRHTVLCEDIPGDPDYIYKKHIIKYELINPYGGKKKLLEPIKITNWFQEKDGQEEMDFLSNVLIKCEVDGQDLTGICDRIGYGYNKVVNEYHTAKMFLVDKQSNEEGVQIHFKNNMKVDMTFVTKVLKDDVCFTKRVQYPAENFRLDYQYLNDEIRLNGQIMGTYLKQSNVEITYESDNSISLETFNWLLPDNGAVVVVSKK